MDRIRGQITRPVLIGAGVGLVLGLILGLIIAWGLWPVSVVDTDVSTMRPDLQSEYLAMTIQSFAVSGNAQIAKQRWDQLGPDKATYLAALEQNPPLSVAKEKVSEFAQAVNATTAAPLPAGEATATTVAGGTTGTGSTTQNSKALTVILVVMCVLVIIVGAILAYLLVFRNRKPGIASSRGGAAAAAPGRIAEPVAASGEGQAPPIVQYLTTYTVGNDLYDDSFSIDSSSGEFLGECGVGISETIGVGDPKKVTAFEVWLFDKNDIQTVTKVLMSQHAFNDPAINQRLASKGEPVLAEPGKRIVLETATLQLEARVVNMNYGSGALPASSFFEQLTLELQVWPKA
jgi:hypothetical protein